MTVRPLSSERSHTLHLLLGPEANERLPDRYRFMPYRKIGIARYEASVPTGQG